MAPPHSGASNGVESCKLVGASNGVESCKLVNGADRDDCEQYRWVAKVVKEYPLPGARQTHEMVVVPDKQVVGGELLLVSQQTESGLVSLKVMGGRPRSVTRTTMGKAGVWSGLHGLAPSRFHDGWVWGTLQFADAVILINPQTLDGVPQEKQRIHIPAPAKGPHTVVENGEDLWISCKDSGHVVRINHRKQSDTGDVYACGCRPICIAIRPGTGDVYATLDLQSKIWHLPSRGKPRQAEVLDIPASHGSTPVGMVPGTDGNVWFVLLGDSSGGTGAFGRICKSDGPHAQDYIQWFHLTTAAGARAGLIHLAFPKPSRHGITRLWLLASSLLTHALGGDAIFAVELDGDRITSQQTITLATPQCLTHRIVPHDGGLFVAELGVSAVAHVEGAVATFRDDDGELPAGEVNDFYRAFGLGIRSAKYHIDE